MAYTGCRLTPADIDHTLEVWEKYGRNNVHAARALGLHESTFRRRLRSIERERGIMLAAHSEARKGRSEATEGVADILMRRRVYIEDGYILVGSDAHYCPGHRSLAHRGMVELGRDFGGKLRAVIMNGDMLDLSTIGRHPRIGWEKRYTVKEELEWGQDCMADFERLPGLKLRTVGNHDIRLDSFLSAKASEMEGVQGFNLRDHFPLWHDSMSILINDSIFVTHRFKGGRHAAFNNTLYAGMTTVTGHLHSLCVRPWTDLTGTRFGVDTGTMADIQDGIVGKDSPEDLFGYAEDNPKDWRSGFVVLRIKDGRLMWPEVAAVLDDELQFRGEVLLSR